MVGDSVNRAFQRAIEKKWDKIYVAVDLHNTVIYPDYDVDNPTHKYTPMAKETLQYLSNRGDVCLIMYTCSHPDEIEFYQENFKKDGIQFDYINTNPEVTNSRYGNYNDKLYFDILIEDKAGFYCETDWYTIMAYFKLQDINLMEKFGQN